MQQRNWFCKEIVRIRVRIVRIAHQVVRKHCKGRRGCRPVRKACHSEERSDEESANREVCLFLDGYAADHNANAQDDRGFIHTRLYINI